MKLKLTKRQIKTILSKFEIYGAETKTKTMRELVALEIYVDSGYHHPRFVLTIKGRHVQSALFALKDLGIL